MEQSQRAANALGPKVQQGRGTPNALTRESCRSGVSAAMSRTRTRDRNNKTSADTGAESH